MVGFSDSLRSELIHDDSHVRLTVVHMPAINTPQFGWCKSRMPRKAQPVPQMFQPDACAEVVYWAAHHRVREVLVGWPTVQASWAQRLVPGLADHLAAQLAWDAQMYDGAPDPDQPIDLYEPVPGHQGARGTFDDRAHTRRWELQLTMRASAAAAAAANLAELALRAFSGRDASNHSELGVSGERDQVPVRS